MKKMIIAAIAATAFVATPALANSGSTTINAVITPVCELVAPSNTGVALSGPTPVGNLYIICNNADGFVFSMTSDNGYVLEAANSPTLYPYTLTSTLFPGATNDDINNQPVPQDMTPLGGGDAYWVGGVNIPVVVNVGPPSDAAYAGDYQDTLTFTISVN